MNFRESKDLTFDKVLIYQTKDFYIYILAPNLAPKKINPCKLVTYRDFCGERGIRTPGPITVNGFQDRRIRPLCHLSIKNTIIVFNGANIQIFYLTPNIL